MLAKFKEMSNEESQENVMVNVQDVEDTSTSSQNREGHKIYFKGMDAIQDNGPMKMIKYEEDISTVKLNAMVNYRLN